jgi:hypothetical protein
MFGLIRRKPKNESLEQGDTEPNPAVALAVGLIYVFRTSAGARLMKELEGAVRRYAADPQALWKLVRDGEPAPARDDVIDTTAVVAKELPQKK